MVSSVSPLSKPVESTEVGLACTMRGENSISLSEMRLLVTAVISFNSDEIVTAVLNIEKIKNALLQHELIAGNTVQNEEDSKLDEDEVIEVSDESSDGATLCEQPSEMALSHQAEPATETEASQEEMACEDEVQPQLDSPRNSQHSEVPAPGQNQPTPPHSTESDVEFCNRSESHHTSSSQSQVKAQQSMPLTLSTLTGKPVTTSGNAATTVTTTDTTQPTDTTDTTDTTEISSSATGSDPSDSLVMCKKATRIDELLNKQSPSLLHPNSAPVFNQISEAILNPAKPLNLTLTNGSRKRKNAAPKQVTVQSILSPPSVLQTESSTSHIALPSPTAPPTPSSSLNPQNLTFKHIPSQPPYTSYSSATDLASLYYSMSTAAFNPTLCGPFITPACPSDLFTQTQPPSLESASGSGLGYLDEVTDNGLDLSASQAAFIGSDYVNTTAPISAPLISSFHSSISNTSHQKPWNRSKSADGDKPSGSKKHSGGRRKSSSSGVDENLQHSVVGSEDGSEKKEGSSGSQLRLRCRRCNERFLSKTDYQQHLQSQVCSTGYTHTHRCHICNYCALTRQRLIVHLRTHTGERPHRCPFCSYAATQQAPLKRHIQNIHLKQEAGHMQNIHMKQEAVSLSS